MKKGFAFVLGTVLTALAFTPARSDDWWKPYTDPCTEREKVFAFTEKPKVKLIQKDRYEITFAVKGSCDVTVAMIDEEGTVVRHLASGVLGSNAPEPFQKDSLKQKIYWDGKDDLGIYVKEPKRLKVRVSLGLKPEFDRFLGATHPKNLPGFVWGITADEDGVYVVVKGVGRGHYTVRKFGHDAEYVKTVYPPPAGLPEEKLGGMGFVEYEPGKKALHAPVINSGTWRESMWMPPGFEGGYGVFGGRPAAAGGRIYFASSGFRHGLASKKQYPVYIHYLRTDGTTEYDGLAGWRWMESDRISQYTHVAASPDGGRIYMVGFQSGRGRKGVSQSVVLASSTKPREKADVFLGKPGKPGSGNDTLSDPWDISCDAKGNVYVTDNTNNRLQIVSPDGKLLKSVKFDRPRLVQVHQKTGAIYVVHSARQRGQSITRVSKLKALPDCREEIHWDIGNIDVMGLDSWSEKPRLWLSAGKFSWGAISLEEGLSGFRGMCVFEEDGVKLNKVSAFDEVALGAAGENYNGRWGGSGLFNDLVCDPVREKLYYKHKQIFDLKTGKFLGWFAGRKPAYVTTGAMGGGHGVGVRGASLAELAFDKRGYMHGFLESGFMLGTGGVCRMDPDRIAGTEKHDGGFYAEVPYNYGEVREARWGNTWEGIIPLTNTNSDPFSWGLGVNMRGDIAVAIQSWFVPKMEEESWKEAAMGRLKRQQAGMWVSGNVGTYQEWIKNIREMEKHGLEVFHIRRQPGIPLSGGTVWTYDSQGEVKEKPAVVAGSRNNGVQIDEDGKLYFTASQFRLVNGKPFMFERGGNYGGEPLEPRNRTPFFGTYIKTRDKKAFFLRKKSKIQADQLPDRPAELAWPVAGSGGAYHGEPTHAWAEGAEWLYAGSSPIVADHCDCPQMRVWLDWFKRSFVPEAYRHSVGVLDTNGNLICHVGEYGNFDSGDTLNTTMFRFVSGTDNYMAVADWGHRIIVARLNYHAEETAEIGM